MFKILISNSNINYIYIFYYWHHCHLSTPKKDFPSSQSSFFFDLSNKLFFLNLNSIFFSKRLHDFSWNYIFSDKLNTLLVVGGENRIYLWFSSDSDERFCIFLSHSLSLPFPLHPLFGWLLMDTLKWLSTKILANSFNYFRDGKAEKNFFFCLTNFNSNVEPERKIRRSYW